MTIHGGSHLLYDVMHPELPPVAEFRGHQVKTFYVRADFSPDGTHIVSGSSDRSAYIWQVGYRAPDIGYWSLAFQ